MAHHHAAKKDIRKSKRARLRNRMVLSAMSTAIKRVLKSQTRQEALAALPVAVSIIDKNVDRNLLKRNTAARKKSRLYRFVNSMQDTK